MVLACRLFWTAAWARPASVLIAISRARYSLAESRYLPLHPTSPTAARATAIPIAKPLGSIRQRYPAAGAPRPPSCSGPCCSGVAPVKSSASMSSRRQRRNTSCAARGALVVPMRRPRSHPYLRDMGAPCVLVSETTSAPLQRTAFRQALLAQRGAAAVRGFGSGVSTCSTCSRRCSNAGGSESRSPRCSSCSSAVNPGPSVAISNSTPLGSRK
jgi:hypothetical protein